jgi:predicted nuclease of predicted toxin-antitoxin system
VVTRLYSNENFPIQVVQVLRKLGHDIVTIQEQGKANEAVADPDVLQFAIVEQRAILTLNRRDFIRLHKSQPHHSGIIVCTVDTDFDGQADRIHAAIEAVPSLDGMLIRANRPI